MAYLQIAKNHYYYNRDGFKIVIFKGLYCYNQNSRSRNFGKNVMMDNRIMIIMVGDNR